MIIGKINDKVLIDDLVLRNLDYEEHLIENRKQQIKEEFEYKKTECVNNLLKEKDKEIERLNNIINETIKDIEHSTLLLGDGQVKLKDTPFGKRILYKLKKIKRK